MPTPLTIILTVADEHPDDARERPTTRLDVQLSVQHGAWQAQTREVLEASSTVPLFDVVIDRLKEEVRRLWIHDQS